MSKDKKKYVKTPTRSTKYTDSPEARLLMAIVMQAVTDYTTNVVKAQWDDLTPVEMKDVKRCRRYIVEESPISHDGHGATVMRKINKLRIPEALAVDRRRRLGYALRDKKRITEAEAKIEKYNEAIAKLEAVPGKVQSSQKEFPYIKASVKTEMVDPVKKWQIEEKIRREETYIERLRRSIEDVTKFVEWCDEPFRDMLTRVFLEGTTKESDEAKALGMSRRNLDLQISEKLLAYCTGDGKPSLNFLKGKTSI